MAYRSSRGVNDLVLLDTLTNESILACLKSHYAGDEIYTYIGQVLISVNPFKDISGLYGSGVCSRYKGRNEQQNAPHVYAIAERAYRRMVEDLSKECVIITGESGAGKTEASKKVMEYIAAVSSKASDVQRVKNMLLESNPLLESFGNAKTLRNNNSSRFGKYMEIQFDIADPVGGRIKVYLLEKNRVIERQEGERNFHIFYQVLSGASASEKSALGLTSPENFKYLINSRCVSLPEIKDDHDFAATKHAMQTVGIPAETQSEIFLVIAAVLHLGNVDFKAEGKDNSSIDSGTTNAVQWAAHLLRIPEDELKKSLLQRKIRTRNEDVFSPLSQGGAQYARDSLAKGLYARLFLWLVAAINSAIHVEFHSNLIGVLDIYGFEIFQNNSFEQLCINYVNEKLHQLFIELTIRFEQDEYAAEGIKWERISYFDNLPIVQLIEGRGQIFALLDEESIFPQGTDVTLFQKLQAQLSSAKNFKAQGQGANRPGLFTITHYAAEVTYQTEFMLDKNKDLLYVNLVELFAPGRCDAPFLHALFAADFERLKDDRKRPITSCVQFKTDVGALMDTLRQCHQHYIRTIKPNEQKRGGMFDDKRVMEQIQYLGLKENLIVRRAGYAARIPFHKFLAKYKALSSKHLNLLDDERKNSDALMKEFGFSDYELGKTKIFIRSPKTLFDLEDRRTAWLRDCQSKLPKEDQLIFADKVITYHEQKALETLFLLTDRHCFIVRDKKILLCLSINTLQGLTTGDQRADGFLVLHCCDKDQKGNILAEYDFLVENVYKSEMVAVVEVLHSSGVPIEVRKTDTKPSSMDANFANRPKGIKAKRNKCVIM